MKRSDKKALFRYLAYAKPHKWGLTIVILAGIAKFTLPLIYAQLWKVGIDRVIANRGSLTDLARTNLLWILGGVFLGVSLLESIAFYVRGVWTVKVSESIIFDLRRDLWRHLQRLSLGFHHARPTGSILSRLVQDTSVAQQMLRNGVFNVVIDLASGTVALIVLLTISWQLTLVILVVLPLYAIAYRRLNPRIRRASHEVQEQISVMSGSAIERLGGIAVVQSFAQEPSEQQLFSEHAGQLRERVVYRGRLNQILNALSHLFVQFNQAAVLVLSGLMAIGVIAIGGAMSAGDTVKFLMVMNMLYLPIRRFSQINVVYQNSMAAIERIFAIFDEAPDVQEKPDAVETAPSAGAIEFDGVRFAYNAGSDVLNDLSFRLAPGERVAIVGESGAGKTTLVTLIPRLYDVTGGAIRIDGLDVRDYRLRTLRRGIGIVLQDPILFSGSIRENLRYARRDASDDEIISAARAANAHQFITELSEGYDTFIGERGLTLSGGQRQRVSLARTILQDPRILILDEATSSLDSESENLITEALQRVMRNRTCLIIAHRLSTVTAADRILVLNRGQIVEDGPHTELLQAGRQYRHLFEQQFGPLANLMSRADEEGR